MHQNNVCLFVVVGGSVMTRGADLPRKVPPPPRWLGFYPAGLCSLARDSRQAWTKELRGLRWPTLVLLVQQRALPATLWPPG